MRTERVREVQGIVRAMKREQWLRCGWRRDAAVALTALAVLVWIVFLGRLVVWLGGRIAGAW